MNGSTRTETSHRYRCLETGHALERVVHDAAPAVLRQSTTCPEHHCPAVRWDGRERDLAPASRA